MTGEMRILIASGGKSSSSSAEFLRAGWNAIDYGSRLPKVGSRAPRGVSREFPMTTRPTIGTPLYTV